jgi:PIN domain nuclease of toxin-antitoxin system
MEEGGAGEVEDALARGAHVSAVNWSEVLGKAAELGPAAVAAVRALSGPAGGVLLRVEPFTAEDAEVAAGLRRPTRSRGLSPGDSACLALAARLGLPALTADRAWLALDLAVAVRAIR